MATVNAGASSDIFASGGNGVLSMLRTTTDTGDLGALSFNQQRLPGLPRATHRRRTNPVHLSDGSHQSYATSSRSHHSTRIPQPYDHSSIGPRSSTTSLQTTRTAPSYLADASTIPPVPGLPRGPMRAQSPAPSSQDSRTFSLSHTRYPTPLSIQRSVSSLRSQVTAPRLPTRAQHMYSVRKRRPHDNRPVSPAMSDLVGQHYIPQMQPPIARGAPRRPPIATYNSDFGVAPLPHVMTHPMPDRYALGPAVVRQRAPFHDLTPDQSYSSHHLDTYHYPYAHNVQLPSTPQYYAEKPMMRPPPFHALRPRATTSTPPSSGPSSSAPPSSDPPTPGDVMLGESVLVDPAFINPSFADQPEEYTDLLSQHLSSDNHVSMRSRAKERPSVHIHELDGSPISSHASHKQQQASISKAAPQNDDSQPAQPLQSRPDRVNTHETCVELPAAPLDEHFSQARLHVGVPAVRITREMVKAVMAPSSSERGTTTLELPAQHSSSQLQRQRSTKQSETASRASTVTLTTFSQMTGLDDALPIINAVSDNDTLESRHSDKDLPLPIPFAAIDDVVSNAISASQQQTVSVIALQSTNKVTEKMLPVRDTQTGLEERLRVISVPPSAVEPKVNKAHDDEAITLGTQDKLLDQRAASIVVDSGHASNEDETMLSKLSSPRTSVQSSQEVAPLQIRKLDKVTVNMAQAADEGTDLSNFIRKSFPRRQSVLNSIDSGGLSRTLAGAEPLSGSTNNRNVVVHMPKLREESQEDVALAEVRLSTFVFPVPTAVAENPPPTISDKITHASLAFLPNSQRPGMPLSELRNLPSLQFSRLDLVDKLNDALIKRTSQSVRIPKRLRASSIVCPSRMRPASTEALRERYTSFFADPENFEVPTPLEASQSFSLEHVLLPKSALHVSKREQSAVVPHEPIHIELPRAPEHKTRNSLASRPLSPEEFLNIASNANRLSIPSVAGLSDRLSELLPSIKHLQLDSIIANDEAIQNTIEEIQHLGQRPVTVFSGRSSAALRTLAKAADEIVTHGTHNSTSASLLIHLNKDLPPLPEERNDNAAFSHIRSTTADAPVLQRPKSALLRASTEGDLFFKSVNGNGPLTQTTNEDRNQNLTHNSRPWNQDENYPWSGDGITIDVGLARPATALCHDSISCDVLRFVAGGHTADVNDTGAQSVVSANRSSSCASGLEPTATVTADTLTHTTHAQVVMKRPELNTRRSGRHTAKSSIRTQSPDDGVSSVKSAPGTPTGPLRPGDRYPSSALVSPLGFEIGDDTPSLISDDSSNGGKNAEGKDYAVRLSKSHTGLSSLKKRFSGLPMTKKVRIAPTILISRPESDVSIGPMVSVFDDSSPSDELETKDGPASGVAPHPLSDHEVNRRFDGSDPALYGPVNTMGKVEFNVKALGERLRLLWVRSGELIRTLSGKGRRDRRERREQEREQWLYDTNET